MNQYTNLFDVRTAYLLCSCLFMLIAISGMMVTPDSRRLRIRLWFLADMLSAVGCLLLGLREMIPDPLSYHLQHLAISASFVLRWSVLRAFYLPRPPIALPLIVVAASFAIYTGLHFFGSRYWLVFVLLHSIFLCLLISWSSFKAWQKKPAKGLLAISAVYLLFALGILVRAVEAAQQTGAPTSLNDGSHQLFFFATVLVTVVVGHIGFVAVHLELQMRGRIRAERREAQLIERAQQSSLREGALQKLVLERDDLIQRMARSDRANLLGLFATSIPHELAQPLAAIRLYTHVLADCLQRLDASFPERDTVHQAMAQIQSDLDRALRILHEMRSLLLDTGPATTEVCDIALIINDALLVMQARCQRERIAIEFLGPEQPLCIRVSRTRLEQVLLILLTNALDAVGSVANETGERHIRIAVHTEKLRARIVLMDSGPGLDPLIIKRLFEPYASRKDDGMGVGLALAHIIAASWGASLNARNAEPDDPLCGAVFELGLPFK